MTTPTINISKYLPTYKYIKFLRGVKEKGWALNPAKFCME